MKGFELPSVWSLILFAAIVIGLPMVAVALLLLWILGAF